MDEAVIRHLAGGTPLAWREQPGGGLVVINARGQKLIFTADAVTAASVRAASKAAPVDVSSTQRAGVAAAPIRSVNKHKGH